VTRGQLPQRVGSLGLNGGGTAAAVPPHNFAKLLYQHERCNFLCILKGVCHYGRATHCEMVPDNTVTVDGLTQGNSYEFRVAAVNEAGTGEYTQTKEPITLVPAASQL